ncbi:PAS domain-containing protein [Sphingomonas sp. CFBP 13603]|uniref:PAS domain-containing protein n=1 Tax=Sphingomonas sp. CFBP 13603 TaxID=2774040 RepID=UPI001FD49BD0|nr:PAS domain-containing protein [Sphingomonas sp. CFBP 13603]
MQRPKTTPNAVIPAQERYQALFEAIDAGLCIIEMMFEGERAVDYRFVEVNPQFESQTGLVDVVGRTASELVPDLERFWFDTYGRVALTGEPARFDHGSEPMGRWFDVHAFPVGDGTPRMVAILFNDVSARRSRRRRARSASTRRSRRATASAPGTGTFPTTGSRQTSASHGCTAFRQSLAGRARRSNCSSARSTPTTSPARARR